MFKRLLLFLLILLLCAVAYFIIFENELVTDEINNERNSEKVDSIFIKKSTYLDFSLPLKTVNQVVKHQIYTLSYSESDEQAEWVAYKLFKNSINHSIKRKDNFRQDISITTGSATLKDYKNSGFDRGHLAPAKTMSYSKETMSDSFFMSNMSPQKPSFNRGIWKKLEEKVRDLILISDSIYVVTGPVLENSLGKIGENKVTIPSAYYKTIIRFKDDKLFGIGFLLKNEKSNRELSMFSVSIDSIEKVTGLNFFYQLDSVVQNRIERNSKYQYFIQK